MNLVTLTGQYNEYREGLDKKGKGLIASNQTLLISFFDQGYCLSEIEQRRIK